MNIEQARFHMIEQQIRPWNVLDDQVLELLSVVRREDFTPTTHRALAFVDTEIPLGRGPGQVMLAPRVEARMLQDLALTGQETVLEIGTGSGYMAALLAQCAAQVVSFECDEHLATQARARLLNAGIQNARVCQGNGRTEAAALGPYDAIVLSGSVSEVPADVLSMLRTGGRLIAIVGTEPMMRACLITRTSASEYQTVEPWDTVAPRLIGFDEASRFCF